MSMKTTHRSIFSKELAKDVASTWDNPSRFTPDTLINIIRCMCSEAATPFSRLVIHLLDRNEYDTLVTLKIDPSSYNLTKSLFVDSQIMGLIKKYPFWHIKTDPKLEAIKTFIACEVHCKETNDHVFSGSLYKEPFLRSVIMGAKSIIADILGDCPPVSELSFDFGSGSTYSVKNKNATAASKLCSTLDVTPNAYGLARKLLLDCPGFREDCEQFDHNPGSSIISRIAKIKGDRLAFVPKTALTHRPIAITGFLNSVLQKGYGNVIRRRMRPHVDLRSAQTKHRELARLSSVSGTYATIDLSNASDTIAYAIVMELLPFQWFDTLDKCRSQYYSYEDKWYPYHKFSAMGNGYTFELESLIFYSLARSVLNVMSVKDVALVYGDDIIIPQQCYDNLIKVLIACGFTPNETKCFKDGRFRESCGGDYMDGIDVRPFYLKGKITYRTLFLLHNFLVRKGWNFYFRKTFLLIRKLIGKEVCLLFRGPDVEGDGHLVDANLPLTSFHRIVSKRYKRKKSHDYSRSVSVILWRISLNDSPDREPDEHVLSNVKLTRHYHSYHRHI